MNLINQIEVLLRADMIDECYYLVIEEFIKFFANINDINITKEELKDKEAIEKIFYFLCWKTVENYCGNKEYIYELMDLRYYLVFEKEREKLFTLYSEVTNIYTAITSVKTKKEKINLAEELKNLTRKENYRLAVDVLEQIYYASKFRKILNKYKIDYNWYLDCEELSYKIQYNIEELAPYVEDIGYEGGINIKYKLERLIDDIKYFEEIV